MIALEDLRKAFGGRTIFDGVSARFERGEVSAIVGPSGGGKSTLLRCINGLERFDEGCVRVGDLELRPPGTHGAKTDRAALYAVRRELGMVFQHYCLFAHMTALANVMEAPVHVKRIPRSEARAHALELLERVGLGHRANALPRELSGGEQQRVAIARALATEPRALLLDEPTGALDPDRKAGVVRVLEDLAARGTTMVLVTHDLGLASALATVTFTLRDGRLEAPARR